MCKLHPVGRGLQPARVAARLHEPHGELSRALRRLPGGDRGAFDPRASKRLLGRDPLGAFVCVRNGADQSRVFGRVRVPAVDVQSVLGALPLSL